MTIPFASLLLALGPAAFTAQDDVPPDGDRLVRVALLANRESIRPGEKFLLGVELTIEPRWHVYWINPGDSGLPTKVEIHAPDGFKVGNVIHPGPVRDELPGDIVTYVHAGRVMSLCEVQAPADLVPGKTWKFEVAASWLVCDELCVPGKGKAEIALASIGSSEAARPAHEKEFTAAKSMIPKLWSELAGASLEWKGSRERPVLVVRVPAGAKKPSGAKTIAELEYFPTKSAAMQLVQRRARTEDGATALEVEFEFTPRSPDDGPETRGLLMVRTDEGRAYYAVLARHGDEKAAAR